METLIKMALDVLKTSFTFQNFGKSSKIQVYRSFVGNEYFRQSFWNVLGYGDWIDENQN